LANSIVNDKTTVVIDFDDSGFSWYLYDLGGALGFLETHRDLDAMIDAWLRGYRRILDLPDVDAREIPAFLVYRRMMLLASMGSHPNTDTAREFGAGFTEQTCVVAERYLRTHGR
jgi:Ser/Thr protein kinase RdoA (MazF antagonist)